MIDEFASLGRLDMFADSLSLIAGYGIKACLIAQDLSQIHAAYGHDEAITSNCHTRVAFTPNRIETARLLSQMAGEATVRHAHRTFSSMGASFSEPEVARPLITPDEATRLGSKEALSSPAASPRSAPPRSVITPSRSSNDEPRSNRRRKVIVSRAQLQMTKSRARRHRLSPLKSCRTWQLLPMINQHRKPTLSQRRLFRSRTGSSRF
jgi:hypothetical protein